MKMTNQEYAHYKVKVLSHLCLVRKNSKNFKALETILAETGNEIRMDNICHDLILEKTTVDQVINKYKNTENVVKTLKN